MSCLASGGLLEKYLAPEGRSWQCPSATAETFSLSGSSPYSGFDSPNQFKPNYNYLAGKEWFKQASLGGAVHRAIQIPRVGRPECKRPEAQPGDRRTAGLVDGSVSRPRQHVSLERSRRHLHLSRRLAVLRQLRLADGHAEPRTYRNVDGYLAVIHKPIKQKWFGKEFAEAFPEQYTSP